MLSNYWQPSAPLVNLHKRAAILQQIRSFFADKNILEVETPLLYASTVTDPVQKAFQIGDWFLQTSPEYAMKRLLAAGSGDIYQICKAFRDDEQGRKHQPEFTMLEWYRIGFDHHALMAEVAALLQQVLQCAAPRMVTYQAIFEAVLNINPRQVQAADLQNIAQQKNIHVSACMQDADKDTWLDLLMTHCIEPQLAVAHPVFIYDYPASQAALAKVNGPIAERFEVYYQGLELANGYHELTDADVLSQRFQADNALRKARGLAEQPIDTQFLAAHQAGLPDCAGVALGVDRLVMLALKAAHINEVVTFTALK